MPTRGPHVADTIDRLLAAPKALRGRPAWRNWEQHSEARIIWPILIGGEISDAEYVLTAYPRSKPVGFRLMITARANVFRVDFDCEQSHTNSFDRPPDLYEHVVGPRHYHAWADNRHFATAQTLPKLLLNARPLPARVRTFDQAQRWFCGQTNISLEPDQIVDLPPSDLLL
jgi:hypothetical protein